MENLPGISVAEDYVKDIFKRLPENMAFHNWGHTAEIVATVMKIGEYYKLDGISLIHLEIAALFHDTGYVISYQNHEDHSIALVTKFFSALEFGKDALAAIIYCIEATKLPQSPRSLIAEILCDADLAHFGSPEYFLYAARLRQEWSACLDKNYGDREWNWENLKVLREHSYKTEYGSKYLQPVKEQNILIIESELSI